MLNFGASKPRVKGRAQAPGPPGPRAPDTPVPSWSAPAGQTIIFMNINYVWIKYV